MHLEKLNVLEHRLGRLIENFNRLKEDKALLESRLGEEADKVAGLEKEVGELRQEREAIRERLGRLVEAIERLETLDAGDVGGEG
jgi:chromosome segregation ATPase